MARGPIPRYTAAELDKLAHEMIAEATSAEGENILSASGFARENISIVHQQRRTANLAWALIRSDRVRTGSVVGIVGGSFSGLMLSVILSMNANCIIYIVDKNHGLLQRFRDKAHRHLSPVLNSRSLGKRFDPAFSAPHFRSPVFAWDAGSASDVAAAWLQEFAEYEEKLPIFTFAGLEVRRDMIHHRHDGVDLDLSVLHPNQACLSVDVLIDATGFGEEANPLNLVDHSYWASGHRLIYDHLRTPANILISGCGDSGVIEGLHYVFAEFSHQDVAALWLYNAGLEAQIDVGLERARLEAIFANEEPLRYEPKILPELIWWLDQRHYIYQTNDWWKDDDPHWYEIYAALNALLADLYTNNGRTQPFEEADWHELEEFMLSIPLDVQYQIRSEVRSLAAEWISKLTKELAESIPLPPNFPDLVALARPNVTIVLNGQMPTAYTRQLSPYNIWTMRLLLAMPNVVYRQGSIASVDPRPDKSFDVVFRDGSHEVFDRVVSRYGPGKDLKTLLAQKERIDADEGDWLLVEPGAIVPDANNSTGQRQLDPVREFITEGLVELEARSPVGPSVSKKLIVSHLLLGSNTVPTGEQMYDDPQSWLSEELRSGRNPNFDLDRRGRNRFRRS